MNQQLVTLEDEITAKGLIQKMGPQVADQLDFTANALASNPLYVAAGLKHPHHKEIIEAFNRGLQAIKTDGIFLAIEKRYGLVK